MVKGVSVVINVLRFSRLMYGIVLIVGRVLLVKCCVSISVGVIGIFGFLFVVVFSYYCI